MRAVTRVNPGQASKAMMWMPTRLNFGEGRCARGKYRHVHLWRSTGISGNGTFARLSVSNSSSGGDRELDEVPAVRDPAHMVQSGPGPPCSHWRRSAACGPPMTRGRVPCCNKSGTQQACVPSHGHSRTAHGRGIRAASVPIKRSTNGCDSGTSGTVLISSISKIRRFAFQRCASKSGS